MDDWITIFCMFLAAGLAVFLMPRLQRAIWRAVKPERQIWLEDEDDEPKNNGGR